MHPLKVTLEFEDFPDTHTCSGEDSSPRIIVEGVLPNIKSLAVVATSSPEVGQSKTSWVVWNIEPAGPIPAGVPNEGVVSSPVRCVQGRNDFGTIGYRGPCPGLGETEAYLFRVYALDLTLHLPPGATWEELVRAMEGAVNQAGEAVVLRTG